MSKKIKNLVVRGHHEKIKSQLFLGPMSKNSVDAYKLSKRKKNEIFLIASRRQIETKLLGGGYVNNWTTEKFKICKK